MSSSKESFRRRPKSTTATLVAGIRAHHLRWNESPIFADARAFDMLSLFWRLTIQNRLLNWLVVHKLLGAFHPIHTENILRIRYTEDRLQEAIRAGISQYVILGAGFDTFSLRHKELAERVRVFEVDHPATQRIKRQRVLAANGTIPPNLTFVPVDFETDRLNEALARSGFDPQAPAFFSWLGVIYYLTPEAIRSTLAHIAAVAAPGSYLVLDYKIARRLVPEESIPFTDKMERLVARLGEPMLSEFTPQELNDEMSGSGFMEIETVPPAEQARRYLQGRSDIVEPPPNFYFALFSLKSPSAEGSASRLP